MIEPKPIIITSLAMRFYRRGGWTLNVLNKYLLKGDFVTKNKNTDDEYYILSAWSKLDTNSITESGHVGELMGTERCPELADMTTSDIIEARN